MGFFRFRRTMKIGPGIRINLNKKSAGVTFGVRGLKHTVNTKGTRTSSVGLPGSGLSYHNIETAKKGKKQPNRTTQYGLPKKTDLYEIITLYQSFAVVAEKLSVSTTTVRKWCVELKLPTKIALYPDSIYDIPKYKNHPDNPDK